MTTYYDGARLPFDYARCDGISGAQTCEQCRRREPGREMWQPHIIQAIDPETGECERRIVRSAR